MFAFHAGRHKVAQTKCPFYPPVHNVSFRTLLVLPYSRILYRTIFTDNCYGAPWGNAAIVCGLLDGVR